MAFTIEFIRSFSVGLFYAAPILIFLVVVIALFGQLVGRKEQWSKMDALYYAFITATTVGYGDFRPLTKTGKLFAVVIAFTGLLLTGIIVAIGIKAATVAFQQLYEIPVVPASI